jgi:hypothetical protein
LIQTLRGTAGPGADAHGAGRAGGVSSVEDLLAAFPDFPPSAGVEAGSGMVVLVVIAGNELDGTPFDPL